MSKITAIRASRSRGKRVNIFLDGKFTFSLDAEVAAKEKLQVEQMLSTEEIAELVRSDHFHRCLNAAVRYLSYRPRSESELRERLRQRSFDGDIQEAVIAKLKGQGLVDDMAFAQFWKDNRESFSPRSQWLTGVELRSKGIANEVIDQVVHDIDDDNSAYRAAVSKVRTLRQSDYQSFCRRLGEYLRRRGFSYEVINNSVKRLWQEQEGKGSGPENG